MDNVSKMKNTNVILIPLPIQIHLLQQNYYFKLLIIFQKIQLENIVTSYFQIHIKNMHYFLNSKEIL